jgi:hypothetical protein
MTQNIHEVVISGKGIDLIRVDTLSQRTLETGYTAH